MQRLGPTLRSVVGFITVGTTLIVGTPAAGQSINESRKLIASDGANGDHLGKAVAIEDGIIAVGSPDDDDKGFQSGAVYVFDALTGAQLFKLLAEDGAADDHFGSSVAISSGIVAVGAWGDENDAGSAYLFDVSTGVQLVKLVPGDSFAGTWFGYSIDIESDIVAVGRPFSTTGAAYLFNASSGVQRAKIEASDRAADDYFASSIAIDGGVLAVGVPGDDDNGFDSGSVYLFDASSGTQLGKLLPSDPLQHFRVFGGSVAIDAGTLAVGAPGDGTNGTSAGAAYVFDVATRTQIAKLLPNNGEAFDSFGLSIGIANGVVAAGAIGDDETSSNAGCAYLFTAATGEQTAKLLASDGIGSDKLGIAIGIANGLVVVGSQEDSNSNGTFAGAAYVFAEPGDGCRADLTGDGVVNTQDFIAYLNAWATTDPIADWNEDGTVNTQDFLAYLNDWVAGC